MDIDLEKFFDRVNHDVLMSRVAKRITDKRVLKLIRAFLNAVIMQAGLVSPQMEGTPQGGPLSPLLSNVLLDELDRELEKRGLKHVRYADDSNIAKRHYSCIFLPHIRALAVIIFKSVGYTGFDMGV
ncbi:reverse transcriptase domain-containing protein [Symbiopectobacterium sp. RP]|uniref:reverse transcriptase domain-containing protein n=1 Tax=Symbiopectobacterium sp. RP TaxID=3248553 RepID=UPI003D2D3076